MKLLLDTHIWIWSLLAPKQLKPRVAKALEDPANELWLSGISVWETVMLVERGRLTLAQDVDVWVSDALRAAPVREAPVTHEIALESGRLTLSHRDPVDRILVATARVLDLTLVTADRELIASRGMPTLANR